MSTRKPSDPTIKRLFADSKGICAECNKGLFPDGINIAVICHIEAFSSGGSRFNKALKIAGKENQYENLIVLCSNCHIIIDTKGNEEKFDVPYLKTLKETHQKKILTDSEEKFDEKVAEEILNKFNLSIENELAEIRAVLKSIVGNNCFKLLRDEFKRTNSFRASFENINSFFFSKSDREIIDTIRRGVELELPQSYILEGPPSAGKTSLIIKLASEIPDTFQHFYISLLQGDTLASIREDLRYIQNFQAIIYIDECHLNNEIACEIYNSCYQYSNLTLIFLYREIDEKVSENGHNLFKNTVSQIFEIDPFDNQNEKIINLIENRKRIILEKFGKIAEVGDFKIINQTINKNLLKLSLLLDEWEEDPTLLLDNINDKKLNELLFKKFLNTKYTKDEIFNLNTYTAINTFEIPFKILDNTNLQNQLSKDALINKTEDNEFRFFHSSFSNLLLLSIISKNTNFDLEYPNGISQFFQITFKKYFTSLADNSVKKYPYKISFSLTKLLVNRQYELYKFLVKDRETQEQILNYFKDITDIEQLSLFFRQLSTSSGNQFSNHKKQNGNRFNDLYEFYYNKLINKSKITCLIETAFKDIKQFRIVLEILRKKSFVQFKDAIYTLSIQKRNQIIIKSELKDITNTLQFISDFDTPFAKFLGKDILTEEWLLIINKNNISLAVKALFVLKQLYGLDFTKGIYNLLNKEKIIQNSKYESLEQIAKSIKELTNINRDLAKVFASFITEKEITAKIQNQPIKKVSKSFKELLEFKQSEIFKVVTNISDDYLAIELAKNNLSTIGKTLSDLFDINPKKIKLFVVKEEFQDLLSNKLSIESDAGQVGKIIADLNKIEPYAVELFLSNLTFNKIALLVENANLQELGQLIHNIFRMKGFEELGKNIFLSIPSNIIASKVLDKNFKITNYDQPLKELSYVNSDKAIEVLELIDNDLISRQTGSLKPYNLPTDYARKVSSTLKTLNKLVPKKITAITFQVFQFPFFDKKIKDLSSTDLLHCYANFAQIKIEYANGKFKKRVESLIYKDIENENISAFSDGLRLLKSTLSLTKESPIIKSFETHLLSNYKKFTLSQISYTFKNLFFIDEEYAFKLITKIDLNFFSKNIYSLKNKAQETSILGEIKTVNSSFHQAIKTEIDKLSKIEG